MAGSLCQSLYQRGGGLWSFRLLVTRRAAGYVGLERCGRAPDGVVARIWAASRVEGRKTSRSGTGRARGRPT